MRLFTRSGLPRPCPRARGRLAIRPLGPFSHGDLNRANESPAGTGAPQTSNIDDCVSEDDLRVNALDISLQARQHYPLTGWSIQWSMRILVR
jgi:hypothetical protein